MTEKQLHFRKLWHPPQLEVDWNKLDNERKPSWLGNKKSFVKNSNLIKFTKMNQKRTLL